LADTGRNFLKQIKYSVAYNYSRGSVKDFV
jgi:hypothetical protein